MKTTAPTSPAISIATINGVAQVASTVNALKSHYYKCLDVLCQANNVDIGTLKSGKSSGGTNNAETSSLAESGKRNASGVRELELFFGGMPILVGLKYFPNLRVLKLFGQPLQSLKPLGDVAATLEELWVCEGPLKNLDGIEACRLLQRVYLYDCEIERSAPLRQLTALETLCLENNRIADFSFVDQLELLKVLRAGGRQFSDSGWDHGKRREVLVERWRTALSVKRWPMNLQHFDVGGCTLTNFSPLFSLTFAGAPLRALALAGGADAPAATETLFGAPPSASGIASTVPERQYAWLASHFSFLERLNGDFIGDKFSLNYTAVGERLVLDAQHAWMRAERAHHNALEQIQRNYERIDEKLRCVAASLAKALQTVPKREGRHDIVRQTLVQTGGAAKRLKRTRKLCVQMETIIHLLRDYFAPSWRLERAQPGALPRRATDIECRVVEQYLRHGCAEEVLLHVHFVLSLCRNSLTQRGNNRLTAGESGKSEELFMVKSNGAEAGTTEIPLNDLRRVVYLCDGGHRRDISNPTLSPPATPSAICGSEADDKNVPEICITSDFLEILTGVDESNGYAILPLFRRVSGITYPPLTMRGGKSLPTSMTSLTASSHSASRAAASAKLPSTFRWSDVEVGAVAVIELSGKSRALDFSDFHNFSAFDERVNAQLRNFRDLSIDIKLVSNAPSAATSTMPACRGPDDDDEEEKAKAEDSAKSKSLLGTAKKQEDEQASEKKFHPKFIELLSSIDPLRYRCSAVNMPAIGGGIVGYGAEDGVSASSSTGVGGQDERKLLSLRNALELCLAYTTPTKAPSNDAEAIKRELTCLDASGLKLTRLSGVDGCIQLRHLSVANNRLSTLAPLRALRHLKQLDAAGNRLTKVGVDDFPQQLVDLCLAHNTLTAVSFCAKLTSLKRLNLNANRIKSLKGMETLKCIRVLQLADNALKDRGEIEMFSNFNRLLLIDISGNAIAEIDSAHKRLIFACPSLLSINQERVPRDDRTFAIVQRKSGKVLTLEYLERNVPNFERLAHLTLSGVDFRMIALDRLSIEKLANVTEMDLSHNGLESTYELVELDKLRRLSLAHNAIVSLEPPQQQHHQQQHALKQQNPIFSSLEFLDLSSNQLTNQTLAKLGIHKLPRLKTLILADNHLMKLDFTPFEGLSTLDELDVSGNDIRVIQRRRNTGISASSTVPSPSASGTPMAGSGSSPQLSTLSMRNNRLKDVAGVDEYPTLVRLDLTNNKISTCVALKPLAALNTLRELCCVGNPVVERRVYADFLLCQNRNLQVLDGVTRDAVSTIPNLNKNSVQHQQQQYQHAVLFPEQQANNNNVVSSNVALKNGRMVSAFQPTVGVATTATKVSGLTVGRGGPRDRAERSSVSKSPLRYSLFPQIQLEETEWSKMAPADRNSRNFEEGPMPELIAPPPSSYVGRKSSAGVLTPKPILKSDGEGSKSTSRTTRFDVEADAATAPHRKSSNSVSPFKFRVSGTSIGATALPRRPSRSFSSFSMALSSTTDLSGAAGSRR